MSALQVVLGLIFFGADVAVVVLWRAYKRRKTQSANIGSGVPPPP